MKAKLTGRIGCWHLLWRNNIAFHGENEIGVAERREKRGEVRGGTVEGSDISVLAAGRNGRV